MAENDNPNTGAPLSPPADVPAAGAAPSVAASAIIAEPVPSAAPAVAPAAEALAPDPALTSPPSLLEEFGQETKKDEPKVDSVAPKDAAPAAGDEKKPAEPAKVEAKPEAKAPDEKKADAAAGDAKPVEPVVPAAVDYKYELPASIKLDDMHRTELHSVLDAYRADPSNVQPLIDLHNKTMEDFAAQTRREQYKVFNETRAGWRKEVLADEEIGGSGHQTAMGAIARMRDLFVPEKDRPAFDEFLRVTGAGDHPSFLRMVHNSARYFDEPAPPPPNPKPSPSNGAKPGKGGVRDLYTHPTSRDQRP